MSKGIVIIALGYPLYGNAAFNLALSLKNTSPEIPIALVYEPNAISKLSSRELTYFDEFIKLDEKFYTINGSKQYQRHRHSFPGSGKRSSPGSFGHCRRILFCNIYGGVWF